MYFSVGFILLAYTFIVNIYFLYILCIPLAILLGYVIIVQASVIRSPLCNTLAEVSHSVKSLKLTNNDNTFLQYYIYD